MNETQNNRSGTLGVRQLLERTNERDHHILASVSEFSFMTTEHLCELHFVGHTNHAAAHRACTRVLERLRQLRVIRRLDQRRGGLGGGSGQYVWMTDTAGDRLFRRLLDDETRPRRKPFIPSRMFLDHTLAVSEAFVSLVRASRRWEFELLKAEAEPANWRSFAGQLGAARVLKPDLYVVTAEAAGDFEDHWFIEIDRGTEWRKALMRKVRLYEEYRRSGAEKRRSGVSPRVLWLMSDLRRVELLRSAIDRDPQVKSKAFIVDETSHLVDAIRGAGPPPASAQVAPSDTSGGQP